MASEDSSSPLVVEKSEVVLVKPSKPTPNVSLSLSTIDNDPLIEVILKTICVCAPDPSIVDLDLTSLLQDALSKALFYYYPLAGKLHRRSEDNRLQLIFKANDGVPFIRATSTCTLSSLNYLDGVGDEAYELVPCYDACEEYDPLALQITRFACGGITIGMAHSHSVCDGIGVAQFFRGLVELLFGETKPSITPVWDRERLTFNNINGKVGEDVDLPNGGSSFSPLPDDMVCEILNISLEDIKKLKNRIAEDELITNKKEKKEVVTTLEILAAHVWRARCRALNMSPDETMVLKLAVGIRSIMEPPLAEGYYGNAVLLGSVALTARELRVSPLSRIVSLIKDMKRTLLDKGYVLGKLREIEGRVKVLASPESIGIEIGSMMLSDWRHIGLDYDGLVNIIPLIPKTMPLFYVLLPESKAVPEMKGGVRVRVTFPRDAMAKFKEEMNSF